MNNFSESILNVIIPSKKDIPHEIEDTWKDKIADRKLHLVPLDDKTTAHQNMSSATNEYVEADLHLSIPPNKSISYAIEDLLEDLADIETLHLTTSNVKTAVKSDIYSAINGVFKMCFNVFNSSKEHALHAIAQLSKDELEDGKLHLIPTYDLYLAEDEFIEIISNEYNPSRKAVWYSYMESNNSILRQDISKVFRM